MASKDYAAIVDKAVRIVPDFPKEGITFRDISTLLNDPGAFRDCIEGLIAQLKDVEFAGIAGIESRGFIFGAPIALELNKKFYMIRKANKLPGEKISLDYGKEYGTDRIEITKGLIAPGEKVIVLDDLLATGGSALAACQLINKAGGEAVAAAFPIELKGLPGRQVLEEANIKVITLLNTDRRE